MNKRQLLDLEKNAQLSVTELRRAQPRLAKVVDGRLQERAHRVAMARLANSSAALRELAAAIAVPVDVAPGATNLRAATLSALRERVRADARLAANPELIREIDALAPAAGTPTVPGARPEPTIAASLRLDDPIVFNPEFRKDLDAAKIFRLSDATGLGDNTAQVLIDRIGSVTAITTDRLEELVKDNVLTVADARKVGAASSLYQVLDERPELVATASATVADVRELVKHDQAAWVKIINDSKTETPGGISVDDYATVLIKKVEDLFPTDALATHLSRVDVAGAVTAQNGLDRLRQVNPGTKLIGARNFASLKTDGISAAEVKKLKASYDTAVRLDRRYGGMHLAEVMDDAALSAAARGAEISRRTGIANSFYADNPEVLAVDMTPRSDAIKALKFAAGATAADKAMVLANARTYQRALAVADDLANAEALIAGGYGSALAIANADTATLAVNTGLSAALAGRYTARAKEIAIGAAAHVGTIIDIVKGGFGDLAVGNVGTEIEDYLKEIPGFADFFGNQDFCDC